ALKAAVKDTVKDKYLEINLKALEKGYEYGRALVGGQENAAV
ncbi:MAG: hypothetical protein PWP65_1193, partial [Clostridia bacterium]|nr:hypothetical protein [Clostridia bacterium]